MNMKKFLWRFCLTASVLFLIITASAWAADPVYWQETDTFEILVGTEQEALGDLSCMPYYEKKTLMVPLRPIAEALGYSVAWCAETGKVTVEDAYTQKAVLRQGTKTIVFEGKLTIINLSRQMEAAEEIVIDEGHTFVPLAFFEEFFNKTRLEGTTVIVEPEMAEAYGQEIQIVNG